METIKTILQAKGGQSIGACLMEAVIYSATNQVNVEFKHNADTYKLTYNDLFAVAKKIETDKE